MKVEEATVDQQQQQEEQSVQDTQLPPPSPPHETSTPTIIVTVKDVPNTIGQNINPLTIEDVKKILHQTTMQSQICLNLVLVSVEELQEVVVEITQEKVNTQEPPTQNPLAIVGQPKEQVVQDTISLVDSLVIVTTTTKEKDKDRI